MKKIITKIKNKFTNEDNAFLRNWEIERTNAAFYGHSHVEEIDVIFSRHIRQIGIIMQVFLPHEYFPETASVLDQKRLVKQLLEGRQILAAIAGETKGWVNHPATKMFRNSPNTLFKYLNAIATEMNIRGYKFENNWEAINKYYFKLRDTDLGKPSWMYGEELNKVITTHRANLYLKAPDLYPQYEYEADRYRSLVCCDRCNYYWPTHVRNK